MNASEPTLADLGERGLIEWIAAQEGTRGEGVEIGIGQDAAVLNVGKTRRAVVTADALIEGVHFNRAWTPPGDLGHKALAVNLSDLAAMAAEPLACFLTFGAPPQTPAREVKEFFGGLLALAGEAGCPLAGGDVVRAAQWTISITAIGKAPSDGVITRHGAAKGQAVYVTGWPGESAAGLEALRRGDDEPELIARHNRPTPRIQESKIIAFTNKPLEMIDVSDGIVNDAGHIARSGGVGIAIDCDALPVSPALAAYAAKIGRDPREFILFGGEDYELLFATKRDEDELRRHWEIARPAAQLTRIGRTIKGEGITFHDASGAPLQFNDTTFRHF